MRVVFMGTPDFAVPSLRALIAQRESMGLQVVGVFTQPDRPKGRGNRLQASPVKQLAQAENIPVFQPEKIRRDGVEALRGLQPELCVTAAFGQILSQEILDIPPLGTINVHASLLPRHRGSAPIAWAILGGDAEVGVTTMRTDRGIDTGDMLLRDAMPRPAEATCGELTTLLSERGAALLVETIRALQAGTLVARPQDESQMTYEPMLRREMGLVDWSRDASAIVCQILGLNPWPGVSVPLSDGRMKLLRAAVCEGSGAPGEVLCADARQGLVIACGHGAVRIKELQAPGGRAMRAEDYLRGHALGISAFASEFPQET